MFAVGFTLTPAREGLDEELDSTVVADIFWSLALSGDGLEHIHVDPNAGHLEITLFVMAGDRDSADHAALNLCRRVLNLTPTLAGWEVLVR
jgi:hypothetical protein